MSTVATSRSTTRPPSGRYACRAGRRNFLFADADSGGERAAAIYGLIGTSKLNGIDPEAWVRHVLTHIADHPANRVGDFLPWNCVAMPAGCPPLPSGVESLIAILLSMLETALRGRLCTMRKTQNVIREQCGLGAEVLLRLPLPQQCAVRGPDACFLNRRRASDGSRYCAGKRTRIRDLKAFHNFDMTRCDGLDVWARLLLVRLPKKIA